MFPGAEMTDMFSLPWIEGSLWVLVQMCWFGPDMCVSLWTIGAFLKHPSETLSLVRLVAEAIGLQLWTQFLVPRILRI